MANKEEYRERYRSPNLTAKDIPIYVPKSGKEVVIELPKGDRRQDFDEDFLDIQSIKQTLDRLRAETKKLEEELKRRIERMLEVLNVKEDEDVRNLLDILQDEGIALNDRRNTLLELKDLTIRIQSKEGEITLSKPVERGSYATAWKAIYEILTMIDQANGDSKGSQKPLLDLMDREYEKTVNRGDEDDFMSRRQLRGIKRLRKRTVKESFSVGDSASYIWNRIKSSVMKLANQIKKGTEAWFKKSRKIDQMIRGIEAQLQEGKEIGGDMLKEKYENPKLTRSGFDVDVDEKKKELRIGIPKSRRQHYDTNMEAAEGIQNEIRGVKKKLDILENKVTKIKETADEALNVLDDDGSTQSLLKVLEDNQEEIIEMGKGVERLAELTIRINSEKFTRTLAKVPKKSPDFKVVVERLQAFLTSVDSAVSQNSDLLVFIDNLIEETKQEAKAKKRRDDGVKRLGESLLYEFKMMQALKDLWKGIVTKVKMFVRRMRGVNQRWEELNDELNMLMQEVLPATVGSMREERQRNGRLIKEAVAKKYTIKDGGEECQCPQCGYPLYVGDTAYETPDGEESGFCCEKCVKEYTSED
jgi:uncharacterized protein YukE